jgi:hypothetical protein
MRITDYNRKIIELGRWNNVDENSPIKMKSNFVQILKIMLSDRVNI